MKSWHAPHSHATDRNKFQDFWVLALARRMYIENYTIQDVSTFSTAIAICPLTFLVLLSHNIKLIKMVTVHYDRYPIDVINVFPAEMAVKLFMQKLFRYADTYFLECIFGSRRTL